MGGRYDNFIEISPIEFTSKKKKIKKNFPIKNF
jgi:hypothetical protein